MYDLRTKLVGQIVSDTFGDIVAQVAIDLTCFSVKTFSQILSSTSLSIKEVRFALSVLIKHRLVTFNDTRKPGTVDYQIQIENVITCLRYPKFLFLVKTLYGNDAEMMVEEIIKAGSENATNILFRTAKRLHMDPDSGVPSVPDLHKKLGSLVSGNLIQRCMEVDQQVANSTSPCPAFKVNEKEYLNVDVDFKIINKAVESKSESVECGKDQSVLWHLNIVKFELLLRNKLIIDASIRRLGDDAGKVVSSVLKLLLNYEDAHVSRPIAYPNISDQVAADHGKDSLSHIYLEQFLRVLADDKTRFIDRTGDSGGGQFQVDLKHILTCLVESSLEGVVLEKFSSKALRIFRYIKEKKYVEENQLQQVVMIPGKETKLLTYQLMENHFIHLKELRKSVAPNAPSKSLYLYYIDLPQVARSCASVCFKAVYNCRSRAKSEAADNARLTEKHEKIERIASDIRASGGTDEQLEEVAEMMTPPEKDAVAKVYLKLEKLKKAQIQADETLFMLKLYLS